MKTVFVDTSGFYAVLDGTDPLLMKRDGLNEAIARDSHYTRENIVMP